MIVSNMQGRSWAEAYGDLKARLLNYGKDVDTGHWQALKNVPHTRTRELQHVTLGLLVRPTVEGWQTYFAGDPEAIASIHHGLNLPWAEDHFHERVAGKPTNPGYEYRNWPWFTGNVEQHQTVIGGADATPDPYVQADATPQFSHTYQERFWPKEAGGTDGRRLERNGAFAGGFGQPLQHVIREYGPHWGIRYAYGDLNDLLRLLTDEPYTRQAYLPIWHPEDLTASAVERQRVPCSLGYHFMLRDNKLHCAYFMRSVDLYRYLTDDLYMAGRLMQWILNKLYQPETPWHQNVTPGELSFFASSVHVFEGDLPRLKRDVRRFEADYGGTR